MGISQFLTVAANTASGNPEPSVGVVVATGLILSLIHIFYARGVKPDGEAWRLGFRDPKEEESVSLASFEIRDAVFCTSGAVSYTHLFL